MSPRKLRPTSGNTVTLLLELSGVPVTHVSTASRVRDASMIVPRTDVGLDDVVVAGAAVTVIFVQDGHLYRWPMRIEEILANSYFLTSVQEPGTGERREFVRAPMNIRVVISAGGNLVDTVVGPADVSAAGLRLESSAKVTAGAIVDLALQADDGAEVHCRAVVVRGDDASTAFEFVELSTADENRIIDLVFQVRAASLQRRIGVKLS